MTSSRRLEASSTKDIKVSDHDDHKANCDYDYNYDENYGVESDLVATILSMNVIKIIEHWTLVSKTTGIQKLRTTPPLFRAYEQVFKHKIIVRTVTVKQPVNNNSKKLTDK